VAEQESKIDGELAGMIELGYMAKRIALRPDWLDAPNVQDVYAVSACIFDSSAPIIEIAEENKVDLADTVLLYYQGHPLEFIEESNRWANYHADPAFRTEVSPPKTAAFLGYDIVTFSVGNAPECSPLSCNGIAGEVKVNQHCLIDSLGYAISQLEGGVFKNSEPGPFRIIAVNAVAWSDVGQ
jgi:hypothetical protein